MAWRLTSVLFAWAMAAMPLSATPDEARQSRSGLVSFDSSAETSRALTIDKHGLHLAVRNRPLDTLLAELAKNSGIVFDRPESLKDRPVTTRVETTDWESLIRAALQGFNHVDQLNGAGAIERVVITGLNGEGVDPPAPSPGVFAEGSAVQDSSQGILPPRLARLPSNAVRPIRLDRARLMAMTFGDELPVDLPGGHYAFIHDNRYTHENGDFTWVGYLKGDDPASRAVITFGQNGAMGRISTPDGLYQIEPGKGGQQWLIDVRAAGLSHSPHHGRELVPARKPWLTTAAGAPKGPDTSFGASGRSASAATNPNIDTSTPTTIDLLVLYTPKVGSGKAMTRVNQLIALANQAFVDSRVAIALRLVSAVEVDYPEGRDNATALRDLTFGQGVLHAAATWRDKLGADLVTLIRPFDATVHKGCGTAWLNGIDGSPLSPEYAFSIVNDGDSGPYYCSDYALAHELAHTMGSAHDRAHTRAGGIFPYSHGYSIPGSFGTVMSYVHPRLGLFSNPDISLCRGAPCGLDAASPTAADNARSLNVVRKRVAEFRPAVR